jgi:uncharacterized protein (TIGR02996 family)
MSNLDPKLVAEILERPLDDGPRLVLADALQEKGDPRGHFIVAQCRLAERGLPPDERWALKAETSRLVGAHGKDWAGSLPGVLQFKMRRGFVDEISGSADRFVSIAAEVVAAQPVTRLLLDGASAATISALADVGAFARVLNLTIRGSLGDDGAERLAAALGRRTTPLSSLNVGSNGIGPKGAAALSANLAGCSSWTLSSNELGDAGATVLASAKSLSKLTTLYLTANELSDDGLTTLAKSTNLVALTRLGVARNDDVTEEGLGAIAASKKLKSLRWLEYTNEDGAQSVAARRRQ